MAVLCNMASHFEALEDPYELRIWPPHLNLKLSGIIPRPDPTLAKAVFDLMIGVELSRP